MAKLGEVCQFINGGTPSKAISSNFSGHIPWITSADIVGPITTSARSFITEEAIRNSATSKVLAGSVLLATRTSVGKVSIAGTDLCFSQDITALVPKNEKLDNGYLLQYLQTKRSHFERLARGATIKGITRNIVADLLIPLPSVSEQRRIAAILDKADALRTKRREALAQLDTLTQSIFADMFGHPISNSRKWPLRKLGEVGSLDRGVSKHRPRNAPELLGGLYPLIQTGEVANCDGYIRSHNNSYSELGLRQSKLWPAGTLCITIAANIAKAGILTFDACFPDSIVGFRPNREITVEYVRVWLSFLQGALEAAAPESAQKNINLAILRELDIPLPPLSLQERFSQKVNAVNTLKITQQISFSELDSLFASLQRRAFRGEL